MTTKSKKIPYTKSYIKYRALAIEANKLLPEDKKLNFNIDGREHYVYRITDYTRTVKQHYYGSRTPPKNKKYTSLISEFWTYRTSSKKNVLNEDAKENYKVKILKVFDNPADKCIYEAYLHQYFDVKKSESFWNESNQTPFGFDYTCRSHSVETKKIMSEKHKGLLIGYKHTEKTKNKMKQNHANCSGENNSFYGKKHTKESIKKMQSWNPSKETREKMSKAQKNRIVTQDRLDNLLKYAKMKKTPEHIKNMCIARKKSNYKRMKPITIFDENHTPILTLLIKPYEEVAKHGFPVTLLKTDINNTLYSESIRLTKKYKHLKGYYIKKINNK